MMVKQPLLRSYARNKCLCIYAVYRRSRHSDDDGRRHRDDDDDDDYDRSVSVGSKYL